MTDNAPASAREPMHLKLGLDPEVLPETVAFFTEHETDEFSPYDLATALVQCDRTAIMPRALFDFIADLYKEAASEGDSDALLDLGALYYDGRGCEQDFTKAIFYYDAAAKLGNLQARENLGYCYYYGRNAPPDYEKAFRYFASAAFEGHLISLYKIGDMYLNGYYVEKDPGEAFRIYDRCIQTMTDEAAPYAAGPVFLRLGNCFLDGTGVEANAKNALICYQKAESFLYDMVADGIVMYNKSLRAAIEGQEKARAMLAETLPKQEWNHD